MNSDRLRESLADLMQRVRAADEIAAACHATIREQRNTIEQLEAVLQRVLLKAVRQQAEGGDILDLQDRLRECGDICRAALRTATNL